MSTEELLNAPDFITKKISAEQWAEMRSEASALGDEISRLIDAFEAKHQMVQLTISTRITPIDIHYHTKVGGSAQVHVRQTKGIESAEPTISYDAFLYVNDHPVRYIHAIN